ncbi:MAG: N-methylhydantoinase, partial [Thermoleophilaceae bacterium]|nr:N-methylhydantoinase [Thermoleophilaceae bacterium]
GELRLSAGEAAAGIARVASAEMAQAVRVVTVERGIDPRDLALVAFGGAGPLHAAQIATELGMRRVLAPLASGVLSALGLIVSERRRDVVASVLLAGDELTRAAVGEAVGRLGEQARRALGGAASGEALGTGPLRASAPELRASFDLRYSGQAFELSIDGPLDPDPAQLRLAFDRAHEERYGYSDPEAQLELVTIRVAAALPGAAIPRAGAAPGPRGGPPLAERRGTRRALFDGDWLDTVVLGPGEAELDGPAIFELPGATLVVPPGWGARSDAEGVVMER